MMGCDFLVLCANSLEITGDVARDHPEGIRYCFGSTKSPFASKEAKEIFDRRFIMHIPESISSVGAILANSMEVRFLSHCGLFVTGQGPSAKA